MSGMELAAHNGFKLALREGRLQTGLWLGLANAYTADVLGGSGFDWLLIDSEHAPNTVDAILGQLQALAGHSVHAVVRSGSDDSVELKRLLDIGATSVLIPMIDSGGQALELHGIVGTAAHHGVHGMPGQRLQLRQDDVDGIRRMLAVDQQPIETAAAQQVGSVGIGQAQP